MFFGLPVAVDLNRSRGPHARPGRRRGTKKPKPGAATSRFGRPGKGNDKGKVEGLVKYARANFLTPIPVAASFDDLNAMLAERCRRDRRRATHAATIGERLAADLDAFRELPTGPLEPCEKRTARVSSTALVRYRGNDYSVQTSHGFQEVIVKGFVDQVVTLSPP